MKRAIKLENMVVKSNINSTIDLQTLALTMPNAEYDPSRFSGLVLRMDEPDASFIVFQSGVLIVTDIISLAKAKKALKDNEDIKELPDMVAESKLNEDSVDMEKHNKLNDMFIALEKLNDEYDELEQLDREDTSSGAGDLTDQLTTMSKLISGLLQVVDRSTRIVEGFAKPFGARHKWHGYYDYSAHKSCLLYTSPSPRD